MAEFVAELEEQMRDEFRTIDTTPSQYSFPNFLIYKNVLAKLTDHSTVYRPMLTAIATAYNTEITALHASQTQSNFFHAYERQLRHANETSSTLTERVTQLQKTLAALKSENVSLTESIESMKEIVADMSAQSLLVEADVFEKTVISNMTLEQMTNVNLLSRELGKLQLRHQDMLEVQGAQFVPKAKFEEVRGVLLKKEERKEQLQEEILELYKTAPAVKQLAESLQGCDGMRFEDILENAQAAMKSVNFNKSQLVELYDDEDPAKEKEAEEALAYVEHLEELLRDENFTAAALHAANSPHGFLRTMNTVEEFKALSIGEGGVYPLFLYCTVLMDTVPQFSRPPEDQSFECVQAAIKENRMDCVAQWVANKHLSLSGAIANILLCNCQCRSRCDCESGTLALAVYRGIEDHEMLIHCLTRQGALYRAVHYAKKHDMGKAELLNLLKTLPSIDLSALLVLEEGLNIGEVLECLQENHHDNIFIGLLRVLDESNDLKNTLLQDESPESVKWNEFTEICFELGEQEIAEEFQGFILSSDAMHKAVDKLIPRSEEEDYAHKLGVEAIQKAVEALSPTDPKM